MDRRIKFATRPDGDRIAYQVTGRGRPLVVPPGWLTHLELEWEDPQRKRFFDALAAHFAVVQWDRHGCGLSDRGRTDFTLSDDILDMETVINQLSLQSFHVFAASTAGPTSIAFAAAHPGLIDNLVLYGTGASKDTRLYPSLRVRPVVAELIRTDWALASKALADIFFPSGIGAAAMADFARRLRESASPEVAAALWEMEQEVTHLLSRVEVPVLVLHRRHEQIRPFAGGRDLALGLANARFVPLNGDEHSASAGDWLSVVNEVVRFLNDPNLKPDLEQARTSRGEAGMSRREIEVLKLVAAGKTNKEIAAELSITLRTAVNHMSNILAKTGAANRAEATTFAHRHGLL